MSVRVLGAGGSVALEDLLTGIVCGWRQTAIIADAGALHMRLRVRCLHLAGVVRLRGLAIVSLHRMLLGVAHRGVIHARCANRVGSGSTGFGLGAGNGHGGNAEDELQYKVGGEFWVRI